MLTGAISIRDLPEAWNTKYRDYLGIDPPSNTVGCLQDVHWSRGSVGYFPTYTFGNLIGVQIWDRLQKDVTNTDELIASGNFEQILDWLVENLYRHGKSHAPKQIVKSITGEQMSAKPWTDYADRKYRRLYEIQP